MPERIKEGIENGYMMEEFEFYGEESKGNWIVNVKFLGNISKMDNTPFVLKCLVYTNFGRPTEQLEKIMVHLSKKKSETECKKIDCSLTFTRRK